MYCTLFWEYLRHVWCAFPIDGKVHCLNKSKHSIWLLRKREKLWEWRRQKRGSVIDEDSDSDSEICDI